MARIATFLYLIDDAARLLRPVSIVARISDHGIAGDRERLPRAAHHGPFRAATAGSVARAARPDR